MQQTIPNTSCSKVRLVLRGKLKANTRQRAAAYHVWIVVAALHCVSRLGAPLRAWCHGHCLSPQQPRVGAVLFDMDSNAATTSTRNTVRTARVICTVCSR
jgi:hypothetical protein